MMDDDVVGFAEVEVGGAYPFRGGNGRYGNIAGRLFQNIRPVFALMAVNLVGGFVRFWRAGAEKNNRSQEDLFFQHA